MGLESITAPYDPSFDRYQMHPSGWYHGASLAAFSKLCATYGDGLAAISSAGENAFFTRSGKLDPKTSWRASALRNEWSQTNADQQWATIKHLPFDTV
jgi:dissimilatory sulfite reductase (desulfoviridin) alpha/beta subunit